MEIEIAKNDYGLEVGDFIFREALTFSDEGCQSLAPCFQATISNNSNTDYQTLECRLSYYDNNGIFLGFDTQALWLRKAYASNSLSMPVCVPEKTARTVFTIQAEKHKPDNELLSLVGVSACVAAIVALALWGISNVN